MVVRYRLYKYLQNAININEKPRLMIKLLLALSIFIMSPFSQASNNPDIPVEMSHIDSGTYQPLYKENGARKNISVEAFLMDIFQITNQQFLTFITENPRWNKGNISPIFADESYLNHFNESSLNENHDSPVINVSWYAALAYCKSAGKTLPTTDQWEYVARASTKHKDASADANFQKTILSWYARPSTTTPKSVYKSPENIWGIHGMHGVIWEQVKDFNSTLVTGESRADSTLDNQFFCGSGAALAADPSDYAAFMRYAFRSSYQANYTLTSLGFRCAKPINTP